MFFVPVNVEASQQPGKRKHENEVAALDDVPSTFEPGDLQLVCSKILYLLRVSPCGDYECVNFSRVTQNRSTVQKLIEVELDAVLSLTIT